MSDFEVEGHVSVHPRGFGFLAIAEQGPADSAFIAPPALNPFLHGDRVRAQVREQKDGRYQAHRLELVDRRREELFGKLTFHDGEPFLATDRRVANTDWPLDGADGVEAEASILARIDGKRAIFVEEITGPEAELERLFARYGIHPRFSSEVETAVEALGDFDRKHRRDLTKLPTLTIDADSSMDLDDALSVLPAAPDGGIRLFVHIADVDALVSAGSVIDVEAERRGTSAYLQGTVIPMLPRALSENRLSLLPDKERPALTAELRIDADGVTTSTDIYPSLIRSDQRLSYDTVAAFFERGEADGVPDRMQDSLRWLRTVAARISVVRAGRGGVEIERTEVSVVTDAENRPKELVARSSDAAHLLIERLMVAANEAVAQWLVDRGLPGIYRVHPEPDESRIEALVESARAFGFEAGLVSPVSPKAMAAFEAQLRHTAAEPTLSKIVSRVLGPASYSVSPAPHFGLAAPIYLHFTSPIRRYADLAVHRIVKAFLEGDRGLHAGDEEIARLAGHLTDRTIQTAKAERERFGVVAARLFEREIGKCFAGRVVAVKTFGLVVELEGSGVNASLAAEDLPDGPWKVDRRRQRLRGPEGAYGLGDRLEVKVVSTDTRLGRIELELVPSK